MKNYYTILGLNKDASLSEIKKAYRRLAVKFHPDKNLDDDGFFEKMFKDIDEAYNILSDSEKRDEYDKSFFYKENQDSYQNQQDDGILSMRKTKQSKNIKIIITPMMKPMLMRKRKCFNKLAHRYKCSFFFSYRN